MVKARWIRLVAGLFVLALLVAACSSDDNGGGTTASTGGSTAATGATAETGGGGGGGTTITIANFAFDPSSLSLPGATDVTITNNDSSAHTFTADDGSFDVPLDPGATETINIAASTGFHCTIHPQMTGSVTVG